MSTAEAIAGAGLEFVFTNGHGTMKPIRFFTDLDSLDQLDWPLLKARYWANTLQDNDRKRRRQAEFLVHQFFPWELVQGIAVSRRPLVSQVRELIGDSQRTADIRAIPGYYY